MGRLRVTPRGFAGPVVRFGVPFAALLVALAIGALLLAASGSNPLEAYRTMYNASLNGWNPITRTLALATPLILTDEFGNTCVHAAAWMVSMLRSVACENTSESMSDWVLGLRRAMPSIVRKKPHALLRCHPKSVSIMRCDKPKSIHTLNLN